MSATNESISITKTLILLALAFTLGFLIAYWLLRPTLDIDPRTPKPPAWKFYPSADFRDTKAG